MQKEMSVSTQSSMKGLCIGLLVVSLAFIVYVSQRQSRGILRGSDGVWRIAYSPQGLARAEIEVSHSYLTNRGRLELLLFSSSCKKAVTIVEGSLVEPQFAEIAWSLDGGIVQAAVLPRVHNRVHYVSIHLETCAVTDSLFSAKLLENTLLENYGESILMTESPEPLHWITTDAARDTFLKKVYGPEAKYGDSLVRTLTPFTTGRPRQHN